MKLDESSIVLEDCIFVVLMVYHIIQCLMTMSFYLKLVTQTIRVKIKVIFYL